MAQLYQEELSKKIESKSISDKEPDAIYEPKLVDSIKAIFVEFGKGTNTVKMVQKYMGALLK